MQNSVLRCDRISNNRVTGEGSLTIAEMSEEGVYIVMVVVALVVVALVEVDLVVVALVVVALVVLALVVVAVVEVAVVVVALVVLALVVVAAVVVVVVAAGVVTAAGLGSRLVMAMAVVMDISESMVSLSDVNGMLVISNG